jgi:SAM-dependent methyltransferase
MNQGLRDIFNSHNGNAADKWDSYLSVYDKWFSLYRDLPINLLEIGVQNGGSLEVWAKYFLNAKVIVGCDINLKCNQIVFQDSRIHLVIGDINDFNTQTQIANEVPSFDIIIDDGSHYSSDIISTFKSLYPLLAHGGLYIIEDLHCSYWSDWQGGLWQSNSAIEFLKILVDILNIESWGVDIPADKYIKRYSNKVKPNHYFEMDSISFYKSMCIISKGKCNKIGGRVVVGENRLVHKTLAKPDSPLIVPPQKKNKKKLNSAIL